MEKSMRKKEAPQAYRSMLPSKYEVLAGRDFSCFVDLRRHGKSIKSGTFGGQGPDFPDFFRNFEGSDFGRFLMKFQSAKSRPKIRHLGSEGGYRENIPQLLEGSAGRAGSVRGFGVCRTVLLNLTRLATPLDETGAADPSAPCGASTAAPYFGARRSVQLVAFCSLQILNRSLNPQNHAYRRPLIHHRDRINQIWFIWCHLAPQKPCI